MTSHDERRQIIVLENQEAAVSFAVQQFLEIGSKAIAQRGAFAVALSGGQTPNAIFKALSLHGAALDWSKVLVFWSDERSVPPSSPESNFRNAMDNGLSQLPIPQEHLFRMVAEQQIEDNARAYEALIKREIPSLRFDLIMLGMGEDGHTASLFPKTEGLHAHDRLVIANYVPQKETWRMTFTYECIHLARNISIYAIGKNKTAMVAQVLLGPNDPDRLPIQKIGTPNCKAIWILDQSAAENISAT